VLHGFVLPGNAEEVRRIDIPESDIFQPFRDVFGHETRILHLRKRRQLDTTLSRARLRLVENGLVNVGYKTHV
jgi:hypothetical protein